MFLIFMLAYIVVRSRRAGLLIGNADMVGGIQVP
jgi:hypothetical protein